MMLMSIQILYQSFGNLGHLELVRQEIIRPKNTFSLQNLVWVLSEMRKHKYVSKYSIISFKECIMWKDVLSYAAFLAVRENILS